MYYSPRQQQLLVRLLLAVALVARRSCNALRLVSWNVLAPIYAPESKYPHCSIDDLAWPTRRYRIIQELEQFEGDIICLQEIQLDLWEEDLKQFVENINYIPIVQETKDHPIANVILIRPSCGWECVAVESRSRALLTVLKHADESMLFLGNVHFQAGMQEEHDEKRYTQIRSLLKRIRKHARDYKVDQPNIVLVGDFNMRRNNPMYRLLETGEEQDEYNHKKKAVKLPFLPLVDAYRVQPPTDPVHTTYCGCAILDYIWTSSTMRVVETYQTHADAGSRTVHNWPNAFHPSDHLAIGATLKLETSNSS
jgi:mRNA deadenylase 3'-5' endonuclease subunit Ccr4